MAWRDHHGDHESENEDDYDSDPYENAPESGRLKMHWSTPRLPDFKRVLNPTRYDERVQKEKEREEEAKEAWKAVSNLAGGSEPKKDEGSVEESIDAGALSAILESFDIRVDLSQIGLDGAKGGDGKTQISFGKFKEFTSLTPRDQSEDMTLGRTVGGTRQAHPGSPVVKARALR